MPVASCSLKPVNLFAQATAPYTCHATAVMNEDSTIVIENLVTGERVIKRRRTVLKKKMAWMTYRHFKTWCCLSKADTKKAWEMTKILLPEHRKFTDNAGTLHLFLCCGNEECEEVSETRKRIAQEEV